MKNYLTKVVLLLAILSPLSQINAGLGYYAGRVAQGLTRGALVGVPLTFLAGGVAADSIALHKTIDRAELLAIKPMFELQKDAYHAKYRNPIMQLFASHPTPQSRIAEIDKRIAELQAREEKGNK